MSSSFWLLGVESRNFSNAEKERTACKAEQINKMTTIFTQNDPATQRIILKIVAFYDLSIGPPGPPGCLSSSGTSGPEWCAW